VPIGTDSLSLRPLRGGTVTKRLLLLAVLVSASALAVTGGASANRGGIGGCSAGFEYISLVDVLSEGPRPSAILADVTGNNDGYVCRRLLGDGTFHRFPGAVNDKIYTWADNAEPS
jgi:hypothetical protein